MAKLSLSRESNRIPIHILNECVCVCACVRSYHIFFEYFMYNTSWHVYLENYFIIWWINREIFWSTHWIEDLLTLTFVVPLYFHYSTEISISMILCGHFQCHFSCGLFPLHMQYMRENSNEKCIIKSTTCHSHTHTNKNYHFSFCLVFNLLL